MKRIKQVSAKEVKRTFVISDLAKTMPLARAKAAGLRMSESKLDQIIGKGYAPRLVAYNEADWHVVEFDVKELGVWSRAGGLPSRWTRGTLADTGRLVSHALAKKIRSHKGRAARVIPQMVKDISAFQKEKYLLPIAFQSGSGTNGRKRLKTKVTADIDDGCMRSVAMAVAGLKRIRVYYGISRS